MLNSKNFNISLCVLSLYCALDYYHFFWGFSENYTGKYLVFGFGLFFSVALFSLRKSLKFNVVKEHFLVFLLFCTAALSVLFQKYFLQDAIDEAGSSTLARVFYVLVFSIVWFLVGMTFDGDISGRFRFIVLAIFGFCLISTFLNATDFPFVDYLTLTQKHGLPSGVYLSHIGISDSGLLISLLSISIFSGVMRKVLIILSVLFLFTLGGRSSLITFIFALLFLHFLKSDKKKLYIIALTFITVAFLGIQSLFDAGSINNPTLARFLFLNGLTNDSSLDQRFSILYSSLSLLYEQILFGGYMKNVAITEKFGEYIHNIISAWQFYGAIFFTILIVLIYRIFNQFYFFGNVLSESPKGRFTILLFSASALSMLFSKYVGFYLFWFALGLTVTLIRDFSLNKHKEKNENIN